jgi:hypothetical protein
MLKLLVFRMILGVGKFRFVRNFHNCKIYGDQVCIVIEISELRFNMRFKRWLDSHLKGSVNMMDLLTGCSG